MANSSNWGGDWTNDKLQILSRYLEAYLTALKNQPFKLGYVDAFAGSGYRVSEVSAPEVPALIELESAPDYWEGSARIALELDPGFDAYVFIEQSADKVAELQQLAKDVGKDEITAVYRGDANDHLRALCAKNWRPRRAVVFLDPYGMQLEWDTLAALAGTEAVDVWILFPMGVAVNRLLMESLDEIPEGWQRRLDLTFGTPDWRDELYETAVERNARRGPSLFEEPDGGGHYKIGGLDEIVGYYKRRLRTIFPHVARRHRVLRSPKNQPLYALLFAAANPNPKAGAASLRIASHLLGSG